MKYKLDKKQITWGLTAFLVAFLCMITYYLVFHASSFSAGIGKVFSSLMGIIYGIVIAYIMSPVLNFVEKKWLKPLYLKMGIDVTKDSNLRKRKQMRKIAIAISLIIMLLILYGLLMIIVPQLIKSIQSIMISIPIYIDNVTVLTNHLLGSNPELNTMVNNALNTYEDRITSIMNSDLIPNMSDIIRTVSASFISIIKGVFNFIVGIIVSVYLLNSKETFCAQGKKLSYALFKENFANEVISEFRFIHRTFTGFITGKLLDSVIIGLLAFIGTSIIGTPYPMLISVIIGVTNIIPFFGPYIGAVVGCAIVVMIDPLAALYLLIFVLILQQFDGNILGPKILGDSTGLSSFWVIFAIMFFGGVCGVFGWIVGVPIFAVLYALVARILNHILKKKNLPVELYKYEDLAYIENGEFLSIHDSNSTKFRSQDRDSAWKKIFHTKAKANKAKEGSAEPNKDSSTTESNPKSNPKETNPEDK